MSGNLLFGKIAIPAHVNNFREFHLHTPMSQHRVKKVACGSFHTLALTDQGVLFSWGGALWDKTGSKTGGIYKFEDIGQIVDMACGDFHSIAFNTEGQVFSWGGGGQNKNKGQLGHSNKKDLSKPTIINFFTGKKVKKVACGDYHTMVLTRDEELYAFG
jgi:RCC1 and BTB domain-containing protein